ncbi:DUF1214 domain-containing protein [Candidatus Litorirhabdus singularis]|nr:DUF1214 domain-containing protein [Candidatus Litorirhabdus singularis]
MDRRDMLKGVAATGVAGVAAALLMPLVNASEQPQGQADQAFAELLQALKEIDSGFTDPKWQLRTSADQAEARRLLLHVLTHAIQTWFEADAARPFFVSFINRHKKMLGDNPDARYHQAVISADHSYRIYGNLAQATYTSFTVETGVGGEGQGLGATLNDTEFEADADGNYEIIASVNKVDGNWLPLAPGAASITTRHYYERELSINNDQLHHIPIAIEALHDAGVRPAPSDSNVAAGIRRVTAFVRGNVVNLDNSNSPEWVSRIPNQFVPPRKDNSNEEIAYAAKDNVYAMAPFLLRQDQALVIRGRWPRCRFASVLLHNQLLQTFDYETRTISLNRKQTQLEADGSFTIVVAHRDPGMPNWLDTEGRQFGIIFWRFQLPEEAIEPLRTEIIPLPA